MFCRILNIYSKKKHRTLEHFLLVKKCVLKFLWLFCTHTGDIQSVFIIKKKNYASGYKGRHVHACRGGKDLSI